MNKDVLFENSQNFYSEYSSVKCPFLKDVAGQNIHFFEEAKKTLLGMWWRLYFEERGYSEKILKYFYEMNFKILVRELKTIRGEWKQKK